MVNEEGAAARIACLGDSVTYGYPFGPQASWVRLAGELLGVPMSNHGLNGDTTAGMLARLQRDLRGHNYTHLIILGGANDAWQGGTEEEALQNVRAMSELARQAGMQPIIGLPTPLDISGGGGRFFRPEELPGLARWLAVYRARLAEWARGQDLPVIDFARGLTDEHGQAIPAYFVDEGHPSRAGYRVLAEHVAAALAGLLGMAGD